MRYKIDDDMFGYISDEGQIVTWPKKFLNGREIPHKRNVVRATRMNVLENFFICITPGAINTPTIDEVKAIKEYASEMKTRLQRAEKPSKKKQQAVTPTVVTVAAEEVQE